MQFMPLNCFIPICKSGKVKSDSLKESKTTARKLFWECHILRIQEWQNYRSWFLIFIKKGHPTIKRQNLIKYVLLRGFGGFGMTYFPYSNASGRNLSCGYFTRSALFKVPCIKKSGFWKFLFPSLRL